MSETSRSPWGEQPETPEQSSTTTHNGDGLFARIFKFLLLLIPAIAVFLWSGRLSVDGVTRTAEFVLFERIAYSLLAAAVGMVLFSVTLPSTIRFGRVARIFLLFLSTGLVLSSLIYLGFGLVLPYSTLSERLILPTLVLTLSLILAGFSPFMKIWPVNVPDNRVWMILDRNDHLVEYVGQGQQHIRPIDGYEEFQDAGFLSVDIDHEDFFLQDGFSCRVRVTVDCTFSPLSADRSRWVSLRDMRRESIEAIIRKSTEHVIRQNLIFSFRTHVQNPDSFKQMLRTIAMDVREAISTHSHLGIALAANDPVKVSLEPTQLAASAKERLAVLEALTSEEQPLQKLIASMGGENDVSIAIESDGQIRFSISPGSQVNVGSALKETFLDAAKIIAEMNAKRDVGHLGESEQENRRLLDGSAESSQPWKPERPPEIEQSLPADSITSADAPTKKADADDVTNEIIDTAPDERGTYVQKPRRNPIIPRDLSGDDTTSHQ